VCKKFIEEFNQKDAILQSIEHKDFDYTKAIIEADEITIAYPIYGSLMPTNMLEFLQEHKSLFFEKRVHIIITQMSFSGDGAALAYRVLKPAKIKLLQSIHINMPSNITDLKIFKTASIKDSVDIFEKADQNIKEIVENIKKGKTYTMGHKWYSRFIGYFAQRLYFKIIHKWLEKRVNIDGESCILCNKCVIICPVDNLKFNNDRIDTLNHCNLCYRCVNSCPTKAITIITKKQPTVQFIHDDYN